MKLRRWLEGAAAIALALSAAGAARAQMSDNVIRIGILNDRSGIYADLGGEGSVVAARMAAEEFGNAIDGVPIEIVSADHQNKADVASGIARQWIDTEQVDMIADVPNSAAALAVQEVTRESNRIFIITGAAATDLTGKACSPTSFHWAYDTRALAVGTGGALVAEGGKSWFFITADYAFGHALERDTTAIIQDAGGEVLGSVAHPLATADFSSFLLQAQASGAQVVGLANAGGDTTNAIKQAAEFGIVEGGQRLAGLLVFISDVHALGLDAAQGLVLTTGFYWDLNDQTREWSKRFFDLHGAEPTMDHAGVYSGVRHYLQAIKDLGTDDATAVAAKMHETPVDDMFAQNAPILPNGRLVHDMYLVQVKTPAESAYPWDYYKVLRTIPGNEAYFTMEQSGCELPQ
jgi:branched-chain amino acid transport system substrate-binding protein